ncbi:MAG TPA: LamG domain-containing protein, partial [Gemmatimonadales bacterium]|nr:LamG domain-containing protein [Gemmatimonadales bacterium]
MLGARYLALLKLSPFLILAACDNVSGHRAASGGDALILESTAQSCAMPPDGLVAWYTGDVDGTDRRDGPTGALINSASIVQGEVGNAFQFDGQSSGVRIPSNGAVDFAPGKDFTIEAWVSVQPAAASREYLAILDKHDTAGRGYSFFLARPGQIGLQLANSSNGKDLDNHFSPAPTASDGGLHHVAVTVDHRLGVLFYVDGAPNRSTPEPFRIPTDPANDAPLLLGRPPSNLNYSLAGRLDEASVYNRVLSPTDIASIYQAGTVGKCKVTITPIDGPTLVTAGDTKTYTATVSGAP